jgi:hypothetical protein
MAESPLKTLGENPYSTGQWKYPKDVGTSAHSIAFYINVHKYSEDAQNDANIDTEGRSRRDEVKGTINTGQVLVVNRETKRLNQHIQLYMPEIMQFDYNQEYTTPSMMEATGGIIGGAIDSFSSGRGRGKKSASGAFISSIKEKVMGSIGKGVASLAKAAGGFALNPVIEVLYTQPQLRNFQFDFTFAPSSKEETDNIKQIILQFRRHQAPEYAIGGLFFISPSQFDIEFYMNTGNGFSVNPNIPKISTCVLKTLNVNYAPQGQFTTFYDGMPVSIQLRLAFQELDLVTRESIDKFGF